MVLLTQAEINEAVMIAKNASYKLAYELTIEAKYGQNINCCLNNLKLLWMYENALACHTEYIKSNGSISFRTIVIGRYIEILINGIDICDTFIFGSTSYLTESQLLANAINAYQSDYIAYYNSTDNQIEITGVDCNNYEIVYKTNLSVNPTVVGLSGGICAANCLSDEKARKLIAKIKSKCSN